MKLMGTTSRVLSMRVGYGFLGIALAVGLSGSSGWAQAAPSNSAAVRPDSQAVRTFYLHVGQQNETNDIVGGLRGALDLNAKVTLVPSQNAIVVRATPDDLELAQRIINELDRAKKTYRVTYTINEMDGSKRIGSQHFTMNVVPGQTTILKQGSKVPVVTGTYNPGSSSAQNQMTYLDVGMNFRASVEEFPDGVRLSTKVEQSNIAGEKSGVGEQDPIVRQTVLEGSSNLVPGKPLTLGSLDIPGSTRHLEIEVVLEPVR
jgi:type II secretory pathway component GspD/PulD (secretin)